MFENGTNRFAVVAETCANEMKRQRKEKTAKTILENVCIGNIKYLPHGPRGLAAATPESGNLNGTLSANAAAARLKSRFNNDTHCRLRKAWARVKCFAFKNVLLTYIKSELKT